MAAIAATEAGDTKRAAQEIAASRAIAANLGEGYEPLSDVIELCGQFLKSGKVSIKPQAIRKQIGEVDLSNRRACQLLVGAALQVIGAEPDLSDELLYEAATLPEFDNVSGNLAGHFLVRKYGRVRNDAIEPKADEDAKK